MHEDIYFAPQRLTASSVKVRRLGYIVALTRLLAYRNVPRHILIREFVRWSIKNEGELRDYSRILPVVRRKGVSVTGEVSTDNAAGRYIACIEQMGFITHAEQVFRNSKLGDVLAVLPTEENPFKLSIAQRHLMLKRLIVTDYDYLGALIGTLTIKRGEEWELFREKVNTLWKRKIDLALNENLDHVIRLRNAIATTQNWKKDPRRFYSENIKATRLEWLVDLRLLRRWNQKANSIILRNGSCKILQRGLIGPDWVRRSYTSEFARCYSNSMVQPIMNWLELSEQRRRETLSMLLAESMNLFRPFKTVNKISANQFLEYSSSKLLESGIVASSYDLDIELVRLSEIRDWPYRYTKIISPVDRGFIVQVRS